MGITYISNNRIVPTKVTAEIWISQETSYNMSNQMIRQIVNEFPDQANVFGSENINCPL